MSPCHRDLFVVAASVPGRNRPLRGHLSATWASASSTTVMGMQITAAPRGYDPDFLGRAVPLPALLGPVADDAVEVEGSTVVDHTHFSLTMSRRRRFARWVAWNVDGDQMKRLSRSSIAFRLDPQVPAGAQVGEELYADNPIDRGHLARRADLTWGPEPEARQANTDSFFFTNIAPQIDDFNQSRRQGVWGRLEDAVYEQVDVERLRISVLGGPVLADDDPVYRGVAVPREFWKVVVYVELGVLQARAFLLTQQLDRLETLNLAEFRTYQVTLAELTDRTGVVFGGPLEEGQGDATVSEARPRPLTDVTDIRW